MAGSQMTISKKSNERCEKFDTPGNINNPDCLHAHIAYSGKEYQERENYSCVEFRINDEKRQFFVPCIVGTLLLTIDQDDPCFSIKIIAKYYKIRVIWI